MSAVRQKVYDMAAETDAFMKGCKVGYDDFAGWLEAMNGPLPAEKVQLVELPRVVCDSHRPAPAVIPAWRLA